MKNRVISYIAQNYEISPEYLFHETPDTAIFRNDRNEKWFAVLMGNLCAAKLGINSDKRVDVLNLKCEPSYILSIIDNVHFFRAYHMNKVHWISVLLDEKTDKEQLEALIDMSFDLINEK